MLERDSAAERLIPSLFDAIGRRFVVVAGEAGHLQAVVFSLPVKIIARPLIIEKVVFFQISFFLVVVLSKHFINLGTLDTPSS